MDVQGLGRSLHEPASGVSERERVKNGPRVALVKRTGAADYALAAGDPELLERYPDSYLGMGMTAELVARKPNTIRGASQ